VACLEKPLKEKRVTATIRREGYIRKYRLKTGKKIEVKYRRKRVGFAVIKDIRFIGYDELFDLEVVRKEGFATSEDLISALKRFWKWHWDDIVKGNRRMPFIEFEWL
jgi:hypothetical protein